MTMAVCSPTFRDMTAWLQGAAGAGNPSGTESAAAWAGRAPLGSDRQGRPWPRLGTHVLGEFFGCDSLPEDAETLRQQMETAAKLIGATLVQSVFHSFNPAGLSGVVVIAESHLAIHTWPEHGIASVDLFTCGDSIDPRPGFDYLTQAFGAKSVDVLELPRGIGVAVGPPPQG